MRCPCGWALDAHCHSWPNDGNGFMRCLILEARPLAKTPRAVGMEPSPDSLIFALSAPKVPCRFCQMEGLSPHHCGEAAGLEPPEGGIPLCDLHLMAVPRALLEVPPETPQTIEAESSRQWSEATGRIVRPGQRVDAIGYLTRKD